MGKGKKWTVYEIEQAIALYITTPFGKLHSRNPDIVMLAEKLGRTSNSVALKMVNLASIDETVDRSGMSNYSKLDKLVWERVFERLLTSASNLPTADTLESASGLSEISQQGFDHGEIIGEDSFAVSSTRQGQSQFRRMISANYDGYCAVSGIAQSDLLIAGHISPWATDKNNRLNPRNGILLNRLHEKAFDAGLIAFSDHNEVLYADQLEPRTMKKLKSISADGRLRMPTKFKPDPILIRAHREKFDCAWVR